jgi:hypothetical protein
MVIRSGVETSNLMTERLESSIMIIWILHCIGALMVLIDFLIVRSFSCEVHCPHWHQVLCFMVGDFRNLIVVFVASLSLDAALWFIYSGFQIVSHSMGMPSCVGYI